MAVNTPAAHHRSQIRRLVKHRSSSICAPCDLNHHVGRFLFLLESPVVIAATQFSFSENAGETRPAFQQAEKEAWRIAALDVIGIIEMATGSLRESLRMMRMPNRLLANGRDMQGRPCVK